VRTLARGFTLIEVLIAISLLALLLAFLHQSTNLMLQSRRVQDKFTGGTTDLIKADTNLRILITNLVPDSDHGEPPIIGDSGRMAALARVSGHLFGGFHGLARVSVGRSDDRLVLRWTPYTHGRPLRPMPAINEVTLMRGVANFTIAYTSSGLWMDSWTQPNLPRLIRLRIALLAAPAALWPDLVIAPILAVD